MTRSIAVILTALGLFAWTGSAFACPATASKPTSQQTVMTDSATNQTPMTTKPGS
jgi:hypothetical protein